MSTLSKNKKKEHLLSHKLNDICAAGEKLVSLVKNCIDVLTPPISANALVLSETYLKKVTIVKEILITAGTFNWLINDDFVTKSLKRHLKQQKNVLDQSFPINPSDYSFQFFCYNSVNLKWNDAFELLTDYLNEGIRMGPNMLLQNAEIISTNIVASGSTLHDLDFAGIDQILKFFLVIYVKTEIGQFFINLKEFLYTPGALEILLNEQTDKSEEDDVEMIESSSQDSVPSKKRVNKGGQKSIAQLFPSIIDITSEFLKQHGLAAQCGRRNDTGFSSDVTINQIRQHLLEDVQELREHNISKSTVRRLFEAPNKSHNAAARYKGHIHDRVGRKCNSYRESHIDAHYLFARNKLRREFVSMFLRSASILSTDDMAKIQVGPTALS